MVDLGARLPGRDPARGHGLPRRGAVAAAGTSPVPAQTPSPSPTGRATRSPRSAQEAIDLGLELDEQPDFSEDVPEDSVIRTEPEAGTPGQRGRHDHGLRQHRPGDGRGSDPDRTDAFRGEHHAHPGGPAPRGGRRGVLGPAGGDGHPIRPRCGDDGRYRRPGGHRAVPGPGADPHSGADAATDADSALPPTPTPVPSP